MATVSAEVSQSWGLPIEWDEEVEDEAEFLQEVGTDAEETTDGGVPCDEEEPESRSDVVRELWQTVQELEQERNDMSEKMSELMDALVNAREDTAMYNTEYVRIHAEGQKLYVTYVTKCEKLKQQGAELTRLRAEAQSQEEQVGALRGQVDLLRAELLVATDMIAALESVSAEAVPQRAPVEAADAGTQTIQISMLSVIESAEVSASLSPISLSRKLEAAAISNELLREENQREVREIQWSRSPAFASTRAPASASASAPLCNVSQRPCAIPEPSVLHHPA